MGQITDQLTRDNPKTPYSEIAIYAGALELYLDAEASIKKLGAVIQDPQTGKVYENPYIKTQSMASKQMLACKRVKVTEAAWRLARELQGDKHGN